MAQPFVRGGCTALRASWPLCGHFDTRAARSVICHVHAAANHGSEFFRACGRETLRGFCGAALEYVFDGELLHFRKQAQLVHQVGQLGLKFAGLPLAGKGHGPAVHGPGVVHGVML